MTVYMCEPWLEGILCGVYDAWSDPAGHENVRLAVKGEYEELELFAEYRDVQICPEKAEKVIRSVCAKLSQEIYRKVYTASLSQDRERADKIYRFLIQAFRHGPSVLVSRIGPKNDIMTLLAPHFADRLPEENWVIYDENHKRAAVHPAGRSWFLVNQPLEPEQENSDRGWGRWLRERTDEETYEDMWRMFCDTIAIRERRNPVCQRTHLPLRFRPYMTEFQK